LVAIRIMDAEMKMMVCARLAFPVRTMGMRAVSGLIQKLESENRNPLENPIMIPLRFLLLREMKWKAMQESVIRVVKITILSMV